LYPASLDFLDKTLMAIGLGNVNSCLFGVVRTLVPVAAGIMSLAMFGKQFTHLQIAALTV